MVLRYERTHNLKNGTLSMVLICICDYVRTTAAGSSTRLAKASSAIYLSKEPQMRPRLGLAGRQHKYLIVVISVYDILSRRYYYNYIETSLKHVYYQDYQSIVLDMMGII